MDEKKRSERKFFLACFFSVVGTVGWFMDKMDASNFLALTALVLGLYGAANIWDKQVQKK